MKEIRMTEKIAIGTRTEVIKDEVVVAAVDNAGDVDVLQGGALKIVLPEKEGAHIFAAGTWDFVDFQVIYEKEAED
jgi:hypothetical protein